MVENGRISYLATGRRCEWTSHASKSTEEPSKHKQNYNNYLLIYIILAAFFTPAISSGLDWSLNDYRFPQLSKTLLWILANLTSAVVRIVSQFLFGFPGGVLSFQVFHDSSESTMIHRITVTLIFKTILFNSPTTWFNCVPIELLVLNSNTWNHLTVCKQLNSGSFKNTVTYN